jgi:anti-anti-sigma regulatory factor
MGIENLSKDALLVTLPKAPQLSDELGDVNEMVSNKCDFDVVIDFARVEVLTSENICNLMILNNLLSGLGHKLVLCSVSFPNRCIFKVTGLEAVFEFADDKSAALESIGCPANTAKKSS